MAIDKQREFELVDKTFHITLILKALFATGEVLGAIGLLFLTPERMASLVSRLTTHWNLLGAHHFLVSHLTEFAVNYTSESQYLAAFYLFSHGAIKLVVIFFLWRKVMKAYPISIAVLIAFIAYQTFEMIHKGSILMGLATLIDILVICLTVAEYRRMKGKWKS